MFICCAQVDIGIKYTWQGQNISLGLYKGWDFTWLVGRDVCKIISFSLSLWKQGVVQKNFLCTLFPKRSPHPGLCPAPRQVVCKKNNHVVLCETNKGWKFSDGYIQYILTESCLFLYTCLARPMQCFYIQFYFLINQLYTYMIGGWLQKYFLFARFLTEVAGCTEALNCNICMVQSVDRKAMVCLPDVSQSGNPLCSKYLSISYQYIYIYIYNYLFISKSFVAHASSLHCKYNHGILDNCFNMTSF